MLATASLLPAAPAAAKTDDVALMRAYLQARIAGGAGLPGEAAADYSAALALSPGDPALAERALAEAIAGGNRKAAVQAAILVEHSRKLNFEGQALLLGEALRGRDWTAAGARIDAVAADPTFAFMAPILRAWLAVDSRKGDPLALLSGAAANPIAAGYVAEHRPLIELAMGQLDKGAADLVASTVGGGARVSRLRIAGAALLARRGERKAAMALLEGKEPAVAAARALVEAGRPVPGAIDDASAGIAELVVRVAVDLNHQNAAQVAAIFARLATFLAPGNSETWLVTSELLAAGGRSADALAALAPIDSGDPFAVAARDSRIRLLAELGRKEEALAEAQALVAAGKPAAAADWARVGDLYADLKRPGDAAAAYCKAVTLAGANGGTVPWILQLQLGGARDQAGQWPEARTALREAYRLAPDQSVVLNYLGYSELEHRENVAEAMRLIADAAQRSPDSAQITDSLGWAHYLQGDFPKAIPLLEKAVAGEPADPAINEHLGDAYYRAGRRYEARYAWKAALVSAEDKDAARLRAKIASGLTPALASP